MIQLRRGTRRAAGAALTALLLLSAGLAGARPVAPGRVTTAVETWLRDALSEGRPDARVTALEPHPSRDAPACWIARLAGGGFCLAGADDRLLPVYLYAPQGDCDPEEAALRGILTGIAARLAFLDRVAAGSEPAPADLGRELNARAAAWGGLAAGSTAARKSAATAAGDPVRLVLPLRSTWHQGPPFNADVAELPGYGRAAVGCVATSLSQLLYYWRWPLTGQGSHTRTWDYFTSSVWLSEPLAQNPGIDAAAWGDRLRWTASGGGLLQMTGNWDYSTYWLLLGISTDPAYATAMDALFNRLTAVPVDHTADFGATTYDWDLMGDNQYELGSAAAVAELCHHAGISVNMLWGLQESYASSADIPLALDSYFRYDSDAAYATLTAAALIGELQWHRPVPVDGVVPPGPGGGHSWLVYGYDQAKPSGADERG